MEVFVSEMRARHHLAPRGVDDDFLKKMHQCA
jgi:hypothetical protein